MFIGCKEGTIGAFEYTTCTSTHTPKPFGIEVKHLFSNVVLQSLFLAFLAAMLFFLGGEKK